MFGDFSRMVRTLEKEAPMGWLFLYSVRNVARLSGSLLSVDVIDLENPFDPILVSVCVTEFGG